MKFFRMMAGDKKHFDSLIRDLRAAGFMIVTYGARIAELEKDDEFVVIEY